MYVRALKWADPRSSTETSKKTQFQKLILNLDRPEDQRTVVVVTTESFIQSRH
jgi:hypothetical protein